MAQDEKVGTIDGSVLEGLFVRELKPTGVFKEELKRAGFDVDRLLARYPEPIFRKAVDLGALHAYAGVPVEQAHFHLGERLVAGYFSTILGRITGGLIPLIGVKRTLARVAQLWQVPQPGMRISAAETGEGWLVEFSNPVMTADLVAGIIQTALLRAEPGIVCSVVSRSAGGGQVAVRRKSPG